MVAVQAGLIRPQADGVTPYQGPLDVERHIETQLHLPSHHRRHKPLGDSGEAAPIRPEKGSMRVATDGTITLSDGYPNYVLGVGETIRYDIVYPIAA